MYRDIGVSNFTVAHLGQLVTREDVKIRPSVNQVDRGKSRAELLLGGGKLCQTLFRVKNKSM